MIRVVPRRPLLETLIAVVDQDKMEISPEYFSGLNAYEQSCLQSMDILTDGRPYDSIWVNTVDGPIEAPVFVDPCKNEITLYHPEEGPVKISPDEVRRRKIDPGRFAKWVQHALFKMPATRKPEPIVPGYAWNLGSPRFGKVTGINVVLARRLADQTVRAKIGHELSLTPPNPSTIVLSTTPIIPSDLRIQRVSVIVPMAAILARTDENSGIDIERLGMFAERGSTAIPAEKPIVDCADDGRWLRIRDREYRFRGGKKAIIRMLFDAWYCGNEWVPDSNLLRGYEGETRLEDVFKDSRADHKGKWRNEPPRVCRRPQPLRGWGHGSEEEDIEQIFT